jgi:MFS family permease
VNKDAHPRRLLIPLGIGLILSLLGDATLYNVLPDPDIAAVAGVSVGSVGLLLGVNRLVRLVSNGPAGALYDRLPRRPLMIGAMTLGALSTVSYVLGRGMLPLLVGRLAWGVAWSGLWIGANAMILDISGKARRGSLSGRLQMWFFIAVAMSSFASGFFTDLFGFHRGLALSAALAGLAVLIWAVFLPETKPAHPAHLDDSPKHRDSLSGPLPWKAGLVAGFPLFAARVVFAGVLAATGILWLSEFFGDSLVFRQAVIPIATLSGIFGSGRVLISVASAPGVGKLSDRLGKRWIVLAWVFVSGGLGLWAMSRPFFPLALAGALLAAVSGGSIPALVPAIVGDQTDSGSQGKALGLVYSVGDLGSAIGPPVALGLYPQIGLAPVYLGCAVLYGILAIFCWVESRSEGLPRLENKAVL